ncbi:MAG: hypothetical protein AB1498_02080 [bacterium]
MWERDLISFFELKPIMETLDYSSTFAGSITQKHVDTIYAVIKKYVFPKDTSSEIEDALRKSSKTQVFTFERHGTFMVVYADVRNKTHPYGIRASGNNGRNFVFRLDNKQAVLVYHNDFDEVENRIELIEDGKDLFLYSYGHIGLGAGKQGRNRFCWNGAEFVYVDH